MADSDSIKESELIVPDGSISKIIEELKALNSGYSEMVELIKKGAASISKGLSAVSGATTKGKATIDEAAIAAERYQRALTDLKVAQTSLGAQTAYLRDRIRETNSTSVDSYRIATEAEKSYNKLKLQLKQVTQEWRALSKSEAEHGAEGADVLARMNALTAEIQALEFKLKEEVEWNTRVIKAEQDLAFARSAQGQRIREIRKEIAELNSTKARSTTTTDALTKAINKLRGVDSDYNKQLIATNQELRAKQKIQELTIKRDNAEVGSYERLSAQYELNSIKLRTMARDTTEARKAAADLEQENQRLYQRLQVLSVGLNNVSNSTENFKVKFNGLRFSTQQVIRELPALAINANTFFLAISNNIPILIDEINKVRQSNKALRAEGKPTTSVIKTIVGALVSWQTALIILLGVLSKYSTELIKWYKELDRAADGTLTFAQVLEDIVEAAKKATEEYGSNMAALAKLSTQWKKLTSDKERLQFIKDHNTEFRKLNVSITSVADAENLLVENTENFKNAMIIRAKVAAATKLAADAFGKSLESLLKQEREQAKLNEGASADWIDRLKFMFDFSQGTRNLALSLTGAATSKMIFSLNAADFSKEATKMETRAQEYVNHMIKLLEELDKLGIGEYHRTTQGRQPKDLTDIIIRNRIATSKKYEDSLTKLIFDESAKREKAISDESQHEIMELEKRYNKNIEYLENIEGKYKELTTEQREDIEEQQRQLLEAIKNAESRHIYELQALDNERATKRLEVLREIGEFEIEQMEQSIKDELTLKLQMLQYDEDLAKQSINLVAHTTRTELDITNEFEKKRLALIAQYDQLVYGMRKADIAAQLELVEKGGQEELTLLLKQLENERQIALSKNRVAPTGQRQSEDQLNAVFNRRADLLLGKQITAELDQQRALEAAKDKLIDRSERQRTIFQLEQERDRWEDQIALAELGLLGWSKLQIETAKATVEGINKELSKISGFQGFLSDVGDKGLGGAILSQFGFSDKFIDGLDNAANIFMENLKEIYDLEVELAEKEVEIAEKRTEAAKSAYDAEIEARNNGYANNVATAKKEYELERQNQRKKQQLLAEAQKKQQRIDTLTQASSLITATAQIWSSLSGIPLIGYILAGLATAAMWTSFGAAKIKARQVAGVTEEYGDGGLEFLEGGSHASGNDIDLQTKNKRKKNMRAEGGEALAIINKRNARKYKKVLPDIINSLNKGIFEDKYLKAFAATDNLQLVMNNRNDIDLSKIEQDLKQIKDQSRKNSYILPNGDIVIIDNNVKRIIKK